MTNLDPIAFLRQVCDDYAATMPPSLRYAFTLVASAQITRLTAAAPPPPIVQNTE
jgi:hypothetical protein